MHRDNHKTGEMPVHVLVATPLGMGGRGGIDRLMDAMRAELCDGRLGDCRVRFGTTRGAGSIWLSPLYLMSFILRMGLLRARGRLDVLHINLSSHGSARRKVIVGQIARWLAVPYVIHLHGGVSRFRTFIDRADARTQARVLRLFSDSARVIVLSGIWRDFVADRVPGTGARIAVQPNASEALPRVSRAPGVAERDGPVRILFLGRLGALKGVPDLVDALERIADLDGWGATIAGDGDVAETRSRADALGLSSRIALPGWVEADDVRALLTSSDILVLPSYDENLPMSVIEGMSAGLAVVATPVGAVADILHNGETGLIVPVGDVGALADALRRLVTDAPLRDRLGDAAHAHHRRHLEIGAYALRLADLWSEAAR